MLGVGCNIINGAGCNRNKMCFDLFKVLETALFARIRDQIEWGDPAKMEVEVRMKTSLGIYLLGRVGAGSGEWVFRCPGLP